MIHHLVRLIISGIICCFVAVKESKDQAVNEELAAYNAVIRAAPFAILNVTHQPSRESLVMLYGFVTVRRRLPYPTEVFYRKQVGAFATRLRALEAQGRLIAEQSRALDAVPLWRSTGPQPPRAMASPPAQAPPPAAAPQPLALTPTAPSMPASNERNDFHDDFATFDDDSAAFDDEAKQVLLPPPAYTPY